MSSGSGRGSSGYQRSGGDVYQAAGAVLTRLEEKKDSTLKAACLQSPFQGKKMLTALVSQTVRYGAVIEALLEVRRLRVRRMWCLAMSIYIRAMLLSSQPCFYISMYSD